MKKAAGRNCPLGDNGERKKKRSTSFKKLGGKTSLK